MERIFDVLLSAGLCLIFYCIGRWEGEKLVKKAVDDAIAELDKEREAHKVWVQNGKKINQIPSASIVHLKSIDYDPEFELKRDLAEKILKFCKSYELQVK